MPIVEVRRANLLWLVERFGEAEIARRLDVTRQRISVCATGKRNVGNALARRIEDTFGLSRGWLDSVHPDDPEQVQRLLDIVTHYLSKRQIALVLELARQLGGIKDGPEEK